MDSDLDWSDIVIPDWIFDIETILSRSHSKQTDHSLPCIETHRKAYPIPVEIFLEIFLYTVHDYPRSRMRLMLVCRHWYNIMLSTPGIHSQLRITNSTKKKDIERFGRRWYLDVTIDVQKAVYWQPFNPEDFFESFTTAAQAASRWRSLRLVRFPSLEKKYKDLQIVLPLQNLETFKLAPSCNLGDLLEPLMITITTTVTPRLTVMEVLHPDAASYLVRPAHFQIFSSLTILRLICRRMQNPVDILPYLHKLETFEAHHLFLPIYSPSVDLPIIQTLRVLHLKSVSVQWMADQTFPALEECSIVFPHHADAIQSVYMPSCSILKYDSNDIRTLQHFHLPPLAGLEVKCGQWRTWRGTLQLATLHPIFASQSLTVLHLQIKCSEKLLVHILALVPALEKLWLGLSSPHALSSAFFLAFAAGGINATEEVGTSSQAIPPLCRQLIELHLHYKRWLRGPERKALIPAFGEIVESRRSLNETHLSLYLSIGQSLKEPEWEVVGVEEKFDTKLEELKDPDPTDLGATYIGFSGPHGIVTMVTTLHDHVCSQHFTEVEYFTSTEFGDLPIENFLPCHSLKEVRIPWISLTSRPNTPLSTNFPFFHAVKVLKVYCFRFSFLAGQAIHKLERYKEQESEFEGNTCLLPEMPVCTRLVVKLSRLASLRLPRLRELGVFIEPGGYSNGKDSNGEEPSGEEPNNIWGNHVAVNVNLSGLKLLQFRDPGFKTMRRTDLIQILRFTLALETLIIDGGYMFVPYVGFFKAFVPIRAEETSGLDHSSGDGQTSGVLCPKLESLQIEGIKLTEQPELMPVLKEIVTLRITIGSPLKSFTFSYLRNMWELIGNDGRFVMKEVFPAHRFELDI